MAIVRSHAQAGRRASLRLLYCARQPGSVIYRAELHRRGTAPARMSITYAYTRAAPPGACRPPGRIDAGLPTRVTWPPDLAAPTCYIAGPAGFVDAITRLLAGTGNHPGRLRTEPFTAPQLVPCGCGSGQAFQLSTATDTAASMRAS